MQREILLLLLLSGNTITDLINRTIVLRFNFAFVCIGIPVFILSGRSLPDLLTALIPGAFLLVFSILSGGSIGLGDAVVLLVSGCFAGWRHVLVSSFSGLLLSSVFASFLLIFGKSRKSRFPFIPFLLTGEILSLITDAVFI